MRKNLEISRALKFKVKPDGKIYGALSESAGDFYIAPEVLGIIQYFAETHKKGSKSSISEFLRQHFKEVLSHLPSEQECEQIVEDLIGSGFLIEPNKTSKKHLNDGFGDPWIQWAMMSDTKRSVSYENALASKINANSVVLDVGSGTGFLSACALFHGAKKVYAIEESNIAENIIPNLKNLNLIQTKDGKKNFVLYSGNSHDAMLSSEITHIISELFGNDPFQEGFYPTLRNISERLIDHNVEFIPKRLEVYGEFIHLKEHPVKSRIEIFQETNKPSFQKTKKSMYGDFLNTIKQKMDLNNVSFPIQLMEGNFERLGKAKLLGKCSLDPVTANVQEFVDFFTGEEVFKIKKNKSQNTVVFLIWFRAYLTDQISISSHPLETDHASHWSPICVILNKDPDAQSDFTVKYNLSNGLDMFECSVLENGKTIGKRE